tara:strand:- start:1599 stop:1880 length:282 start_codon:yes stop_codon:yes gene_type:complete
MTKYDSILDEAKEITGGSRQKDYGHPIENFTKIANLWNAYLRNLGIEYNVNAKDVSIMLILFKVAREQGGHKRDNLVDLAGYTRTAAMIEGIE